MSSSELSPDVLAAVQKTFTPENAQVVGTLLLEYGVKAHEREVERVRKDIIKLANDDLGKLRRFFILGKRDLGSILGLPVWETPARRQRSLTDAQ